MSERGQGKASGNAKAGRALLWAGSLVFLAEAWMLLGALNEFWQRSGAASLGWMVGVGAAVQKAVSFLVWNDGLALAVAAKVLVLCCPLLVIAVGIGLMRSSEFAQAGEFGEKGARAEEERL